MKLFFWFAAVAVLAISCRSRTSDESTTPADAEVIAAGEALFRQDCSACHTFERDAIGPRLGGLTAAVSPEWIMNFIADPKKMIESGDERSGRLYDRYKTFMPSFGHYDNEKLVQVAAFLKTKEHIAKAEEVEDPDALKDPIPERIAVSGLVAELELVATLPFSSEEKPRTRIVKMEVQPGTGKLFALDLRGTLYDISNGTPAVYFDMAARRPDFIPKPGLATGFGSVAFHPDFSANGLMYTTHTEPAGTRPADFAYADSIPVALQWVLTEWKAAGPKQPVFEGEGRELLRINMVTGMHGVQELAFNPTAAKGEKDYGLLYMGIGDGACTEHNFPELLRHRMLWGSIIRIDPKGKNSANGQYGIPADNPFSGGAGAEIFAFGFRNPHHLTWLQSGEMLASNIGQADIESYNQVQKGGDYGWPIREGTFLHRERGNINAVYALPEDDKGFVYPVIQYDHDEGNAVSDGYEYTGKTVSLLKGKFFFGDIMKGRLFYTDVKDIAQGRQAVIKEWQVSIDGKITTMDKLCGESRVDMRIGRDANGELYIFTKPDGKIYRIAGARLQGKLAISN